MACGCGRMRIETHDAFVAPSALLLGKTNGTIRGMSMGTIRVRVSHKKLLDEHCEVHMWQWIKETWRQARMQASTFGVAPRGVTTEEDQAFLEEVFATFPFAAEGKEWLRAHIYFKVQDLAATSGGGYWDPSRATVFLYTAQYEAAIHELAHAWWHARRIGQEEAMMQTTVRLSEESDLRYRRTQQLAYGYINGIPEQHWAGMLIERNDWEMYAGLASGMMADLRLVPPYVRAFYAGLFTLLPDDAPSPAEWASHG